jgi:hypothetical protein
MKSFVIVEFQIEGFHYYPDAPSKVLFLSNNHRHTFKIKCGYQVTDLNREKEIFMVRDELIQYLSESFGVPCLFKNMSCEMIAKELVEYGEVDGMVWCEVWEEETGGARIEL